MHSTPLKQKHPNLSERAIQTYKDMLHKRVKSDEKQGNQNIKCIDYNFECLLTYIIIID